MYNLDLIKISGFYHGLFWLSNITDPNKTTEFNMSRSFPKTNIFNAEATYN